MAQSLAYERLIYHITFIHPDSEMTGKEYAICFVLFGLAGTLLLYAILECSSFFPGFFLSTTPRRYRQTWL